MPPKNSPEEFSHIKLIDIGDIVVTDRTMYYCQKQFKSVLEEAFDSLISNHLRTEIFVSFDYLKKINTLKSDFSTTKTMTKVELCDTFQKTFNEHILPILATWSRKKTFQEGLLPHDKLEFLYEEEFFDLLKIQTKKIFDKKIRTMEQELTHKKTLMITAEQNLRDAKGKLEIFKNQSDIANFIKNVVDDHSSCARNYQTDILNLENELQYMKTCKKNFWDPDGPEMPVWDKKISEAGPRYQRHTFFDISILGTAFLSFNDGRLDEYDKVKPRTVIQPLDLSKPFIRLTFYPSNLRNGGSLFSNTKSCMRCGGGIDC